VCNLVFCLDKICEDFDTVFSVFGARLGKVRGMNRRLGIDRLGSCELHFHGKVNLAFVAVLARAPVELGFLVEVLSRTVRAAWLTTKAYFEKKRERHTHTTNSHKTCTPNAHLQNFVFGHEQQHRSRLVVDDTRFVVLHVSDVAVAGAAQKTKT